jgi:hypothetical protein
VLQLTPIELDWRGPVEAIQHRAVFEASLDEVPFERLLVAALDLVGEQQGEKRHVVELLGARQRQPPRPNVRMPRPHLAAPGARRQSAAATSTIPRAVLPGCSIGLRKRFSFATFAAPGQRLQGLALTPRVPSLDGDCHQCLASGER